MEDKHLLSWEELRRVCDPATMPFDTTADVPPLVDVLGQKRAVRAIEFALDISSSGFNLFVAGQPGTGKTIILRRILNEAARSRPVPQDVLYVHNFDDPETPRVLRLPAGEGSAFRDDVHELVQDLKETVPKAFESKEYADQKRTYSESNQQRRQESLEKLQKYAREMGYQISSTPAGFQTIPLRDGKPVTQEDYDSMDEADRQKLDADLATIQGKVRDFLQEIKGFDHELKKDVRELDRQVALNVLGTAMLDLRRRYGQHDEVLDVLANVEKDIVENIDLFRRQEEDGFVMPGLPVPAKEPDFTRYVVNVIVDNSSLEGAPVVIETNPTYYNLLGRIERRAQFGALITDFTMIRAGSLAKANGGYLVLNIEDTLRNPFVYEALKRAIRNRQICIEELSERVGMFSTQALRPQPIPLDVKVCLIGKPLYYHLLFAFDEEFRESFKVKADFDYQGDRTDDSARELASFVARLVKEENLLHFDRTAIAALVDESSRWVEDQEKVSLCFGQVNDLVREAAYWGKKAGKDVVSAAHVERATSEIEYRSSLSRERVQELIQRDVLQVDTAGEKVGQINGLAVHMLGDYLFGRPSRITANVHVGSDGVINIERRVSLSHSTHDKGVMILAGFFGQRFAQDQPLSFSASLAFEQSYGEIAGDSASSTELYALLSALSGVPIRQGIAVSGSVNQKGEVQAVGGINFKIEGFFDICNARGLSGDQGVLIPRRNARHLMLRQPVIDAVRAGKFRIWAIEHVDEGIEILTGTAAGERDAEGNWTAGSINQRVQSRLVQIGRALQAWGREEPAVSAEVMAPRVEPESPTPPKPPERPRE